ncbi:MAG: PEP-CTERM sorting domain-containing protein [Phycisphaerae bacterium]
MVLYETPAYNWTYGCSPTAGMMALGYYDEYGYANMVPGSNLWSANYNAIKAAIASAGNVSDYALYQGKQDSPGNLTPDISQISPGSAHPDDSLADFMKTSRSALGLAYGETWSDRIAAGLTNYASWRGYSFTASGDGVTMPTWSLLTNEIQHGRPVILNVCTDFSNKVNHTLVAFGYRDTGGVQQVAVHTTWGTSSEPEWWTFRPMSTAYTGGIGGYYTLAPTGATDSTFSAASGDWGNIAAWAGGLPGANTFAYLPSTASVAVTGNASAQLVNATGALTVAGNLTAQAARVGESGQVDISGAGAAFSVGSSLTNFGLVTQDSGQCQIGGNLLIRSGYGGPGGRYAISGGSLMVGGTISLAPAGCMRINNGQVSAGEIEVPLGARLEWLGGTLSTPLLHIPPDATPGLPPELAIGFDVNVAALVDGSLFGGVFRPETGAIVEFTNGANVTQSGTADIPGIAIGSTLGSATYTLQSTGSLTAGAIHVGLSGTGRFTQLGGSVTIGGRGSGKMVLGGSTGASGLYELQSGSLSSGLGISVGDCGIGTFLQRSGTVDLGGSVEVARLTGSTGAYQFDDGYLRTSNLTVGNYGAGSFTQSSGKVAVSRWVYLALSTTAAGCTGNYVLSGGELSAGDTIYVGYWGQGSFVQNSGTVSGNLTVGEMRSGILSTYDINGGVLSSQTVRIGGSGQGRMTQDGGAVQALSLYLGFQDYARGTYLLSAGGISAAGLVIGGTGSLFKQTGGDVTLTGGMTLKPGNTYELWEGTLSAKEEGPTGGGRFLQYSGTHTVSSMQWFNGDYYLYGGSHLPATMHVGYYDVGRCYQSGGIVHAGTLLIGMGYSLAHGRYYLSGGNLVVDQTCTVGGWTSSDYVNGSAMLDLGGGTAVVGELIVGPKSSGGPGMGELRFSSTAATLQITRKMTLGSTGTITAVPGAVVHMTGATFENQSTTPASQADLLNLTMIFEGGPAVVDTFEVSGRDFGATASGFTLNFALGTLQLGGTAVGNVRLVDATDNQPGWVGRESLYVSNLVLGSGSSLDLNGINLYYGSFVDNGGTVTLNGGALTAVPEPSTVGLLAASVLHFIRRRRREEGVV